MPAGDGKTKQLPHLSAAASRTINRTPLTPKIAVKVSSTAPPLAKRARIQTPVLSPSNDQIPKDDVDTPVNGFLPSNITPRSGRRQYRVDSANTTPNGTPNPEKVADVWDTSSRFGLGVSTLTFDRSRQTPPADQAPDSVESKFFYASDAKPCHATPNLQQRPVSSQKAATFFYAGGETVTRPPMPSPSASSYGSSIPSLAPLPDNTSNKFFYANGAPGSAMELPPLPLSNSGSMVSTSSKIATGRPSTTNSTVSQAPALPIRPSSPIKAISASGIQPFKMGLLSQEPHRSATITSVPVLAPIQSPNAQRRVSDDAAPKVFRKGHLRTGSVPVPEGFRAPFYASPTRMSPEPITASPPLSPSLSHPAMSMASILQAVEDLAESGHGREPSAAGRAESQSPTKVRDDAEPINDLVANARRERKVQDLEITNVSLEAINRTLERQLRKQTTELRRYRRLSRSGRLSLASGSSSRVASGAYRESAIKLSDLIEDDESEELDESDCDSDEMSSDSNEDDDRAAARQMRDQKRLQLDLVKHQQLLIDSQKVNQSIKRCMDRTEALIKEGQKALEYHVRPSEVEYGGRILGPQDDDEGHSHYEDSIRPNHNVGLAIVNEAPESPQPPWVAESLNHQGSIGLLPPDTG